MTTAVRLRTAPELATLLLELGRLIRARRFYAPGDARLAAVFERSLRAWSEDLSRRGSLELELLAEGFREAGGRGVLCHPQLSGLQQDLAERGVHRLRFEPGLDGEAFAAFAEVLATDAGRTASRGGFAAALYAHSPSGIIVNDLAPALPAAPLLPAPKLLPRVDELSLEDLPGFADEAPPEPPAHDLETLLEQLDGCTSASTYLDLARRTTLAAERAFDEGERELAFRAFTCLAGHAAGKAEEPLRELAGSFLRSLAQGPRLAHVIERAVRGLDAADLAANQVLLVLGEETVPALLDAAAEAERGAERERLAALVVTFGERALPSLLDRLAAPASLPRVRAAIRVAGELQHPDLVAPLARLLEAEERGVRDEAVRSLVRLGSEGALDALAAALESATPGLAQAALHGLASTESPRAVEPLRRALDQAIEARDVPRAKELIRALGRLGRPEAGRALVRLLDRRVRFGGGWLRELKSAAASALGAIPGDEAVAALAQAAQTRDTQLRRAAQIALDRRAQSRTRAGS